VKRGGSIQESETLGGDAGPEGVVTPLEGDGQGKGDRKTRRRGGQEGGHAFEGTPDISSVR